MDTLGLSRTDRLLLLTGAPLAGLALAFFLPRLADWLLGLRWIPFRGPIRVVETFDDGWALFVTLGVGLLLGLGFAVVAIVDSLTVTVSMAEIRLTREQHTRTIPRSDVDAVFLDGKRLVVLDRGSRQLVYERHEARSAEVARVFRAYGYPWRDADPYTGQYRRWVPDTPDLPAAVNVLLKARGAALEKKNGRDIAELRDEVQKLGYVVRDEGNRQYWRPCGTQ
jgi:hypothetical protein